MAQSHLFHCKMNHFPWIMSRLLHPMLTLPSCCKVALLLFPPPAFITGNISWVLAQKTHEGKDYVIFRSVKSFLIVYTPVEQNKTLKNITQLICCSSQLQPLQIQIKYLLVHTSQQGIPPAKSIILAFKNYPWRRQLLNHSGGWHRRSASCWFHYFE